MNSIAEIFKKPYPKFKGTEADEWVPFVYELALRSLPIRDIAAKLNCHPKTLADYPVVMAAIAEGHADHRLTVEHELYTDATNDPMMYDDPVDKASVRAARTAALKMLKLSIDKKEGFIPPAETERIRRLSDEELQVELQKHLKSGSQRETN